MLQLERLNARARAATTLPEWDDIETLEAVVDDAVQTLRRVRSGAARGLEVLHDRLDRVIHTRRVELLDRPDVPEARKVVMIRRLDRLNRLVLTYPRLLRLLRPHVVDVARRAGRPARLLELACGAGELSLQLSALAARRGLPLEVTGSDIVPGYVEGANREAEARGLPVRFRRVDALELDVERGAFDLLFIAQSVHHFSPGQLAVMIARAEAAGAALFIAADGRRALAPVFALPLLVGITGDLGLMHDALLSARRFYSEAELRFVAEAAAPSARVELTTNHPLLTVLTVTFDRAR